MKHKLLIRMLTRGLNKRLRQRLLHGMTVTCLINTKIVKGTGLCVGVAV